MVSESLLKRGFIIFSVLVLFILSSSFIEAKKLHGDYHFSGEPFEVDDSVYMVTHFNLFDETVILDVNENSYVITNGDCKVTPTMRYCIDEIYRDVENSDEDDPIKFEEGVVYAGIYVRIETRGPDISISREFSTTSPELNEVITVTVTVENDGDEGTDSFIFMDSLPQGVIITSSSSGTERTSRRVMYDSNIPLDGEKTFTYSFKITDYIEITSEPTAHYVYEGATTNVSVSSKKIEVSKPYKLTVTLAPKTIEATDQSALSVKVENTVSDEIDIKELRITIPSYISVQTKPGELDKKNEKYYWSGSIESDEYKLLNFVLRPVKSGKYEIPAYIHVVDSESKEFTENKTVTLTSEIEDLKPILSVRDKSVSEGGSFRVAFSIENANEKVGFRNIQASVKSILFSDMDAQLDELLPGQIETLIVNDDLAAPFLDDTTKYDIEASGTYGTNTNENFEFSKKETLTVTPVSEAITIIQSVSSKEITAGENVTVDVKIKNNNEEAIQVDVEDSFSEGASLIGGKRSDRVYFDSTGTEQAYVYILRVPIGFAKEELEITTKASILNKNYEDTEAITVAVKEPEVIEGEESEAEPEPEEEPEQLVSEQKEPGFFEKVIDEITNFFKRLLKIG